MTTQDSDRGTNNIVAVATYDFGLADPEDIDLIPANQNLHVLNFNAPTGAGSSILKIPKENFASFAGDVLITAENAALFIVHWTGTGFVVRQLVIPAEIGASQFEHVCFAPF